MKPYKSIIVSSCAFALFAAIAVNCRALQIVVDSEKDVQPNATVNFSKLCVSRLNKGIVVSYDCVGNIENAPDGSRYQVLIDSDISPKTGKLNKENNVGADYMVKGDKLFYFNGSKWCPAKSGIKAEAKGSRNTLFIPYKDVSLSRGKCFSIYLRGVNQSGKDDYVPELANGPLFLVATKDIESFPGYVCKVSDKRVRYEDSKNDVTPEAKLNLTGADIRLNKNAELEIDYTLKDKIIPSALKNCLIFIDVDDNPSTGYTVSWSSYPVAADHLIQNGSLYKYIGKNNKWKWDKVCKVQQEIAGNTCKLRMPLSKLQTVPGRMQIIFKAKNRNGYDWMPELVPPRAVFTPGNLAAGKGTDTSTTRSYGCYLPENLVNGQISRYLPWQVAAWASSEHEEDKHIKFTFAKPQIPKYLTIYWNQTSQRVSVEYRINDAWREVACAIPGNGETRTDIKLPDRGPVRSLRLVQKAGDGPPKRKNIMWIKEIEIY
jgi:hypothetical protein